MTFRLFTLAISLASLCGACDLRGGSPTWMDADADGLDGGLDDAGAYPTNLILLVTEPHIVVPYGSSAKVTVMLLEQGSRPLEGATVQFTMHGRANDSSLSHFTAITDENGAASVELISGRVESTFSIRVASEGFEPVYVSVTVSAGHLATLGVVPSSDLGEHVVRHRVQLYGDVGCDSARIEERDFDRTSTIWEGGTQTEFPFLPITNEYAVTVEALDFELQTLALRCIDGVSVSEDGTVLAVPLDEHVVQSTGPYDSTLRIELGDAPSVWASAIAGVLAELGSEGLPEAEALVAALEAELLDRGDTAAVSALQSIRQSVVDELDALLEGRGPVAAVDALAAELARLSVLGSAGSLDVVTPDTIDYSEISRFFEDVTGNEAVLEASSSWEASGLFTSPIRASVELKTSITPSVVAESYLAALAEDGDVGAWLIRLAGCDEFASFTPLNSLSSTCDAACLLEICDALVGAVFDAAMEALDEGLEADPALEIEGMLVFTDPSFTSTNASRFIDAGLSASLPGHEAELSASFKGTRLDAGP
jgi:hypothetical protein